MDDKTAVYAAARSCGARVTITPMGVAAKVSQRNVRNAAATAVAAVEQCIARIDDIATAGNETMLQLEGVARSVKDVDNRVSSVKTQAENTAARLAQRLDAQASMVTALEAGAKVMKDRHEDLQDRHRDLWGRVDQFLRVQSFFGRLRWLFTGRIA